MTTAEAVAMIATAPSREQVAGCYVLRPDTGVTGGLATAVYAPGGYWLGAWSNDTDGALNAVRDHMAGGDDTAVLFLADNGNVAALDIDTEEVVAAWSGPMCADLAGFTFQDLAEGGAA